MCGIAGIIDKNGLRYDSKDRIHRMLDSITYRGPDGRGIKQYKKCSLGHVRLSIIDLNGGVQPIQANDTEKCLVFNGEIYGFRDIKKEVEYPYVTDCDTEVILALNEKYSDHKEMLAHLPGMFSFALWDNREQTLFCGRDRFGEKPFYYAYGEHGEFVFASEIKAIIASGLINPSIDDNALRFFVKHSWIYPNTTIYKNIYVLPPAHYLTYHNGNVCVERYWEFPCTNNALSLEEASEEFERLFKQAVERQVISDVPVGAYLSGGLDSGSVVAQMAQILPQVTTISFASTTGYDESPLARSMAQKYNTNHIVVRDSNIDIENMLFKMQTIFDEPFADPAAISAYSIAKEAREYVKVILSGDAGDEICGGYATFYRSILYAQEMKNSGIPLNLQKSLLNMSWISQKLVRKAKFIMGADVAQTVFHGTKLADTEIRMRAAGIASKFPRNIAQYHRDEFMNCVSDKDLVNMGLSSADTTEYISNGLLDQEDALDNIIRCDLLEYLPSDGLLKTDRTTMAVSLESRTPFCDVDLAEFCISLPYRLKVDDYTDKVILRKSMGKYWTKEISNNIKTGFSPPWDKWLNSKAVEELTIEYLYNKNAAIWDHLDYKFTTDYFKTNRGWSRWILLNLGLWFGTRGVE